MKMLHQKTAAAGLSAIALVAVLLFLPIGKVIAEDHLRLSNGPTVLIGSGTPALNGQVLNFDPITINRLTDLGIIKPREVNYMLLINAIGSSSSTIGGGLGYTCDSQSNLCTCDNTDPLDCLIIFDDCAGPLEPVGGGPICHPDSGDSCTCQWK